MCAHEALQHCVELTVHMVRVQSVLGILGNTMLQHKVSSEIAILVAKVIG